MRLKRSILRNFRWQKKKMRGASRKVTSTEKISNKTLAFYHEGFLPTAKKNPKPFQFLFWNFALVSKKKNESELKEKQWIRFERSPQQARTRVTRLFSTHFLWSNCSFRVVALAVLLLVNSNLEGFEVDHLQPKKLSSHTWVTISKWDERKITATTREK